MLVLLIVFRKSLETDEDDDHRIRGARPPRALPSAPSPLALRRDTQPNGSSPGSGVRRGGAPNSARGGRAPHFLRLHRSPQTRFNRTQPGNSFRIFEKGGSSPLSLGIPTLDGLVFVNINELVSKIREKNPKTTGQSIYVRADADAHVGALMLIMGKLKAAGIDNVSMVTEPLDKKAK